MRIFLILLLLIALPLVSQDQVLDASVISKKLDDLYRSDSSHGIVTMQVTNPRFRRTLKMEVWSLGKDYTLLKILAPKKEKGTSTLKKGTEMWNYLPKIKKMIRIPPSMMMSSWMGSDFTNDDLVKESSWEDDYNASIGQKEGEWDSLIFVPKPDAAVIWGKVVLIWDSANELPIRQDFYDEKGVKVRTMAFSEPRNLGGRRIPAVLTLTPLGKENQNTIITYQQLDFDIDLERSFFSKSQIRK